jgi:uncharacterized membrane protein YraQ (UPF0718 family)
VGLVDPVNTVSPVKPVGPTGPGRRLLLIPAGLLAWVGLYLGLKPGSAAVARLLLGDARATHFGQAVEFFLFETPKVLLLLTLVVFAVGIVRSFFTPERTRRALAGRRESAGNVLAALLGVVTPFCSCSAVPLFIGFVEAGVPLGVTFSFLISAPMVNEVALVLLFGLFGWKVAALYLATGLAIAISAGWVIGRLKLERYVEAWVYQVRMAAVEDEPGLDWSGRLDRGLSAVREIVGKVWPWVLGGIAVGAGIHGWVPEGFLAGIMGKSAWWSVPAAVLIGVPMYSNAAGIIPVVSALLEKGAALGTVLAFMMAVIGLSLPETIILRKVLRPALIGVFVGVVAVGILAVGYLFNLVL